MSQSTHGRFVASAIMTTLVASGLAFAGIAPAAHAANTVKVNLRGAQQGNAATLLCRTSADPFNYDWTEVDYEWADQYGFFTFSTPPASYPCTVRFSGNSIFPSQTIGGHFGWPNWSNSFTTFTTTVVGDYTGAFQLVQPATIQGRIVRNPPILDPSTTRVRLYQAVYDKQEKVNRLVSVDSETPTAQSAFTFEGLDPQHQYAIRVDSPGFVSTWYGGATGTTVDPYNPKIGRVVAPRSGATAPVGAITISAAGAAILGTLSDFGVSSAQVWATNLVTGETVDGEVPASGTSYAINGLQKGTYMITAQSQNSGSGDPRYTMGVVSVPASGSVALSLRAELGTSRLLGNTTTAIQGDTRVGSSLNASSTTFGQGSGLSIGYDYTWFTQSQILGTGPKLTVPNLLGESIFVLTKVKATNTAAFPRWFVSSAYGKVLLQSAPKFTVKTSGTLKVGKKLKTVLPKSAKGWKVKYQWQRNGKAIKGKAAQKSSYKLTKKDKGKKISVKITYTKQGFTTGKAVSKKTKKVAAK